MLMRIFGPKRDEVAGEWRKLLNEELNDLYASLYRVTIKEIYTFNVVLKRNY